MELSLINRLLGLSCLTGILLSFYALSISVNLQQDKDYQPMCDLHERISCSVPFKSRFGTGFGLFAKDSFFDKPNSLYGIFFYSVILILTFGHGKLTLYTASLLIVCSNFASIYFAYILYFKLYDLCIVCVATYVVNFANLLLIEKKLVIQRLINLKKQQ